MKTTKEWDAGQVAPSPARYIVSFTHGHKTLQSGDIVVMAEAPPYMQNVLIRERDMTLHAIQGQADQYVHLNEIEYVAVTEGVNHRWTENQQKPAPTQ
jgi:hypothetical protein